MIVDHRLLCGSGFTTLSFCALHVQLHGAEWLDRDARDLHSWGYQPTFTLIVAYGSCPRFKLW
jgi:hypothetical protein